MIYFNQATTSYPKPKQVINELVNMMENIGGSPGRSEDATQRKASSVVMDTRQKISKIFNSSDPKKVLFFQNATVALNQAIKGLAWKKGDHIITSTLEHNSVRRPIHYIKKNYKVDVTTVNPMAEESIIEGFKNAITDQTKAIIITHVCNVTGDILPVKEIGEIAREHNLLFIVDGSQSVGHIPISAKD